MIFSDLKRLPKAENNRSPQDPMFNIAQDKKDSTIRAVPVRNTDLPVLARRSERHCDLGAYCGAGSNRNMRCFCSQSRFQN